MGWLSGYSYRKKVTISGSSGAGTNYQVKLSIGSSSGGDFHLEGHCEDFPNDIRFTDDDGTTLLDYWIEDPSEDPITVWVKVQDNLDSDVDIYVYYGKSGDSSASDGEATFPDFFDDFEGTSLDSDKWDINLGTPSVNNSILDLTSDDRITTDNAIFTTNRALRARLKIAALSDKDCVWGGVTAYANWDNVAVFRTYEDSQEGGTWTSKNDVDEKQTAWDYVTGTYKTYDIIRNGTTSVIFKEDEVTQATHSNQVPDASQKVLLFTATSDELNVDWILIRKYTSPEPSFSSAGSEEEAPLTCVDVLGTTDETSRSGPVVRCCTDILKDISSSSRFIEASWLPGFAYRKRLTISGSSGAGTGYQIKLKIGSSAGGDFHLNGHCDNFPNDIRFTKDDGLSLLNYWIEDPSQDPVTVWIKIEDNLDNNVDIYCYYGSSLANSESDGDATFELFEDEFEGFTSLTEVFIDQHDGTYPRVWAPRVARMPNGKLLAVYSKSTVSGDNLYSEIWGAFSDDNGQTWGTPFLIQDHNAPTWGALEPSLLVDENKVFLIYLRWYSYSDSRIYRKVSTDSGETWGNDVQINTSHSYNCQTKNGIRMQDGTLIVPFSFKSGSVYRCAILKSTDGGETWTEGGQVPASGIGSNGEDEPTVVELSDHSLYMLLRNDGGHLLETKSTDKGNSWTTPVASDLVSPDSNACLFRLSWSPNKILVAWDDSPSNRYPLKVAISTDDCDTWTHEKTIKSGYHVAYPSIALASDGHIIVAWWDKPGGNDDTKSTRFTEDWLILENKWEEYGSGTKTVNNGVLSYSGETGPENAYGDAIESQTNFSCPIALRVKYKFNDIETNKYATIGFGRYSGADANTHYATEIFCRHFVTANATGTRNLYSHEQESLDWRIMDIKWLSDSVEFKGYVGETTYSHTFTSFIPSDSIPVQFGASWATNNGNFSLSLDWILVRKYVSPEPSLSSTQAEEGPVFTCGDTLVNLSKNWWAVHGTSSDTFLSSSSSLPRIEFGPVCSEILDVSDSLNSILLLISCSQDTLGFTDSNLLVSSLILNAIDSIDISDGCTLTLSLSPSCLDVLHNIDSASYPLANVVSCLDSLGTQDSVSSFLSMLCQSKDNIGGADDETSQLSVEQVLLDILAFQDTSSYLAGIIASASDILNVQDLNSIRLTFSCSSIDIIKNVDSGGANVTFHLDGSDLLKGADFVSGNLQVLLDSLSVFKSTDQSASSLLGFILRSASDVLDMYDLNSTTLQISSSSIDLFKTEDNSSVNISLHLNSADLFKNSDSAILNLQALLSALEALEISDSSASSLFAEILASASDLLATSDYNGVRLEFLNSSIDVIKSEDRATPSITLHLNSSDILHGLDSVTTKLEAILRAVSEFKGTDRSSTRRQIVHITPVKIFKAQQKILVFKAENI